MSLQFIFGNSGSGKSQYLYEHIIRESMEHPKQNYIVLVPEQFTMQTQKEFVTRHPRHGIMNIDILSFERMAFRILEEIGEGNRIVLDDEGKNLILRKVAGKMKDSLTVLGKNVQKPGYISEVKSVISEFAQYGIPAEELSERLEGFAENPSLYYKLQDIQKLYQGFEEYLEQKYITREELLDLLCRTMHKSRILQGAVIALDGFTGFTPVQNKVLGEMLCCCEKLFLTVTIDEKENPFVLEDRLQLFALSKQMILSLTRICKELGVEVEEPIRLYQHPTYRFRNCEPLAWLEKEIFRYQNKAYDRKQEQVVVSLAKNPREEIEAVAQRIRYLVRKKQYRYQDLAVIVSDLNVYGDEIEKSFAQHRIPVFMDYKRSILLNSFVEYVRSLLSMVEKNFSYEGTFRFLRSGFSGFPQAQIDILENYVRGQGIRGYKRWQEPWTQKTAETTDTELEAANEIRRCLVEKIDSLARTLKQRQKTIRDITVALYEFLRKEELQDKVKQMEEYFQEEGQLELAKEYAQIYRVMIELFDKLVSLLGEETIALKEYNELLDAGIQEARIGVIPPGMDQVMAGDIERTRLKDVKVLFLVGMNEQYMAPSVSGSGLLSEQDRERLEKKDILLSPGLKEKIFIQKYYLYLHMTKPTEGLEISCSKLSSEGKSLRPSYVLNDLKKIFPMMTVTDLEERRLVQKELVEETGVEYVIRGLRDQSIMQEPGWAELYQWYKEQPKWGQVMEQLSEVSRYRKPQDALTKETAERLYGDLEPSISRMEEFVACACAHFLKYGLRLKDREEYEFAALDFGNIIHKSLEHYAEKVAELGVRWERVPEEQQKHLVEESVEESIADYSTTVLYSSARNAYMIPRMKRMLSRTVWALSKQLEKGEFVPQKYEVGFGSGKIDRIDVCEDQNEVFVKVIDYKTGSKSFDMSAFYHGIQMQLVIYMNEALKLEEKIYPGKKIVPAGIFYYRTKDPMVDRMVDDEELERAILKALRLDGIVSSEETVIRKLDGEFTGESEVIPVKRVKNGYSKASRLLSREDFEKVLAYAQKKKEKLKEEMREGKADPFPYEMDQERKCQYCGYKNICGFDESIPGYEYHKMMHMTWEEALERIQKEQEEGEEGCQ